MQTITYELKYCERCGSLRLRRAASSHTYCQSCEQALFNLPRPGEALLSKIPRRKGRPPKPGVPILQAAEQLELAGGRLQ